MAQVLQIRLTDRIGEALAGDIGLDTEMLDDWCTLGVKDIIMRMPQHKLEEFAIQSSTFVPATGLAMSTGKVLYVVRGDGNIDRRCRKIPSYDSGRASDSQDILYATANDPVYYYEAQTSGSPKIKVLPISTSSVGKAFHVTFPTVDVSADTAIAGFPDELEPYVELYAVIRVRERELGINRRGAQDEIEAITTTGILANLATTYTDIETALDAANTETDKLSAIIDLANIEFDKVAAIIVEGSGEIDNVKDAGESLALINTAVDRVNVAVQLANTEFDLMNAEVDTADTSISTNEDIELGTAELQIADKRASTGTTYLQEAAMAIQEAQGYATEAKARLDTAQKFFDEAGAYGKAGNSYIQEAQGRLGIAGGYLQEAQARVGKAQTYIAESGVRLQTAGHFLAHGTQVAQEIQLLKAEYENGLKAYIGSAS